MKPRRLAEQRVALLVDSRRHHLNIPDTSICCVTIHVYCVLILFYLQFLRGIWSCLVVELDAGASSLFTRLYLLYD